MEKRVVCAQRLEDADVAVIGGGTAGCFAAIAAASGARTVLIEKMLLWAARLPRAASISRDYSMHGAGRSSTAPAGV